MKGIGYGEFVPDAKTENLYMVSGSGISETDGRTGERQKGAGKEQGREARITENVPGNLIWKERPAPCFGRAFFYIILFLFMV